MSKLILGLDLGITSIGWALVSVDKDNNQNNKIIDSGVRIFTIAEHPKDGKSLALPRREARSARRTTKRKAQKKRAIKRLLQKYKVISAEELEHLFIGNKNQTDVWQLRRDALYRKLTNKELSRVMIHIAKHRGYASNRKSEEPTDNEGKAVLGGIRNNQKVLEEKGYLTIGEYLSTKEKKRNSNGNYENSISRKMLQDEIDLIFAKQKEYGNTLVNDTLLQEYKTIAFTQRPLKSVEGMVANCPFETLQKRAPKASLSFEIFRALQKLKNLRIITQDEEIALSKEQILQVIEKAKTVPSLSYKQLKKFLDLDEIVQFKGLSYFDHKTGEAKEPEKAKLLEFSAFIKLKKAIEEADHLYWSKIENDNVQLDKIAEILSTEKDDNKSLEKLRKIIDSETVCQALLTLSFSGFGHISIKALQKINPYLAEGLDYDKACEMAGYDFKAIFQGDKTLLLPPLSPQENLEMTNPVVKRAIAQMRLVYNALARKYGALDAVHVELTRDIKKSHKDRNKISKAQEEFQIQKEEAKVHAKEVLGKEPNAKELLKFRLWKEQNKECIYSGKYIDPRTLCDPYATEVDHVLPYSRSLDDSLNNKVLCLTKENQNKGNKTPFEYFGSDKDTKEWQEFVGRIEGLKNLKQAKKSRLTKTNFDQSSEQTFKERNKNDTSYIAKFVKNYIEAHIAFKESKDKQHVFTRNGMLTSQLRYKWGVGDKNRQTHLHHAEDAIIVAFSTQAQVQKLSETSSKREGFIYKNKEEKAQSLKFEPPMKEFGKKVQESVESIFVSYMPRRKVSGAAHKETIYSKKIKSKGIVEINGGLAENGEVKRIDVFEKNEKFHFVYLYPHDFVKDELKSTSIKDQEIDSSYKFKFSIYKNDLIELLFKEKNVFGYLIFAEGDGRFNVLPHSQVVIDKKNNRHSTGSLQSIKKYQVDPLGNYVEVKQEKRQGTKKQI
ncbi:MAG: type II CRISPR RNA-guided endonuclease Cas9 [Epsilonproteobacteria bacterium]|nr:type II CRISPR RNA-guided endonuclease Cas9 [Campylobacterota bacterium]